MKNFQNYVFTPTLDNIEITNGKAMLTADTIELGTKAILNLRAGIAGNDALPSTADIISNGTSFTLMEATTSIIGTFSIDSNEITQGKYLSYGTEITKDNKKITATISSVTLAGSPGYETINLATATPLALGVNSIPIVHALALVIATL